MPSSRQAPSRQVAAAPAGEQRPASKEAAGKQRQEKLSFAMLAKGYLQALHKAAEPVVPCISNRVCK